MADLIKLRRDTTSNWESENPVLHLAEPGIEFDASNQLVGLKIGDGTTAWTDLDYLQTSSDDTPVYVPDSSSPTLEYTWDGINLGFKSSDERNYNYVNLKSDSYINKTLNISSEDEDVIETTNTVGENEYTEKTWHYQKLPVAVSTYKNRLFQGETIVNYDSNKKISGVVWWADRKSEDYRDLIKLHIEAGVPVSSDTNWENFINSDNILYIANTKASMEVLANSEEAKDPITDTVKSMNSISKREISRNVIGFDSLLYNTIIQKSMAVGKYISGYAGIDPRNFSDVDTLLDNESAVNIVLDNELALQVLTDSEVARLAASTTATFTINLAYHADAMHYIVDKPVFLSDLIEVPAACEHLIDTDISRAIIYGNESAFYLFITNNIPMGIIASYSQPGQDIFENPILLEKLLDTPTGRTAAFSTGTFVGNFIYHHPAVDQLVDHEFAVSNVISIDTMISAVIYDTYCFDKFAEDSNILDMMIANQNCNDLIKDSTVAMDKLYTMSPTTVPVLSEPENSSASSYQDGKPAYLAFNDDSADWWETDGGNTTDEWIAYNFITNVWCFAVKILGVTTTACPQNCKVQFHDGSDWIDATETFTVARENTLQEFTVCHPIKSNHWRLFILNNYGSSLRIEVPRLQFYCQ